MNNWLERIVGVLLVFLLAVGLCSPARGQVGTAVTAEMDERAADYYEDGRDYLDDAHWSQAVRAFDKVIALGISSRAPGAYYWKAYALSKQSRAQDALGVLAEMERAHPESRWSDDARVLQVELRQSSGKPVSPESESNEELKLIALNALMHVDQERALPMLEKILRGHSSPQMKEQALFVLVQTDSPRAREIVMDIAQGNSSPDLQYVALEHIGMFGESANLPFLKEIWDSTDDLRAKRAILGSYMMAEATPELLAIAENERDDDLRREALQYLGHMDAEEELLRLYDRVDSVEDKGHILEGLAMSNNIDKLMEVSRTEKNAELRLKAIQSLGMVDDPRAEKFLLELYESDDSVEVKGTILEAMMWHGNVDLLIRIARTESNRELKLRAVEVLSMMDSPQATEFLLELLDE